MVTASQTERRLSVLWLNSSKVSKPGVTNSAQSRLFCRLHICILCPSSYQERIYRSTNPFMSSGTTWTWGWEIKWCLPSYHPHPDLRPFYPSCFFLFLCLSHWTWSILRVLIRSLIRLHYNCLRKVLPWVYPLFLHLSNVMCAYCVCVIFCFPRCLKVTC